MFSDFVVTTPGRSFTITSHDIFMPVVSLVIWPCFAFENVAPPLSPTTLQFSVLNL